MADVMHGLVYVMRNPAMPGLLKIGRTILSAEERALALYRATGVPAEFEVLYYELVSDCVAVESRAHRLLSRYRNSPRKEYFRVSIVDAIKAVQTASEKYDYPIPTGHRVDITRQLANKYHRLMHPTTRSVSFVQFDDACVIEIVRIPRHGREDRIVTHTDLRYISAGSDDLDDGDPEDEFGDQYFSPRDAVTANAQKFLELEPKTFLHFEGLLHEGAAKELGFE